MGWRKQIFTDLIKIQIMKSQSPVELIDGDLKLGLTHTQSLLSSITLRIYYLFLLLFLIIMHDIIFNF